MLAQLTRAAALEARLQGDRNRSTPEWASTHPLSENRMAQASQLVRQTGRAGQGMRNRDAYLAQIDGVIVDDDPEQGVIDGRTFTHPELGMQFTVPTGYLMQNGTRNVSIQGSAGQAQFSGGALNGNMDNYIYRVIQGIDRGPRPAGDGPDPAHHASTTFRPPMSSARANTSSGAVDRGRVCLSMGCQHRLPFRDADTRRSGVGALYIDGGFASPNYAGRGGRGPAQGDRCGDGATGRYASVAGRPHGLSGFPARSLSGDQRVSRQQPADAGPKGQDRRLRSTSTLNYIAFETSASSLPHMPPAPPPNADSAPMMATAISDDDQPIFNNGRTTLVRAHATAVSG